MITPDKETLELIRRVFPQGARVELVAMDDKQAPPVGTKGTVVGVDDMGTIHVNWDNGSGIGVAWGIDDCRRVTDEEQK